MYSWRDDILGGDTEQHSQLDPFAATSQHLLQLIQWQLRYVLSGTSAATFLASLYL